MAAEFLKQGITLEDWAGLHATLMRMEDQLAEVARRVHEGQATEEELRDATLAVARTRELSAQVLPRAVSNVGGTGSAPAPATSPGPSFVESRRTRTVLVVDDNPAHRYAVARVLRNAGFNVAEAWHGQAALDAAAEADAVVLDIFMPGMDGWQVCRSLRANPATEALPILFFSAAHGDEAREECERAGGDAYYPTPVVPEKLVGKLACLMGIDG
jgi:CheY-like chemotaxis protein